MASAIIDAWYSLGLRVGSTGIISDVRVRSPADQVRITPGQHIYAINGLVFSREALLSAIRDAKGKTEPIHLILQQDTFVTLADINYHDGERYPQLVRVDEPPTTSTTSPRR